MSKVDVPPGLRPDMSFSSASIERASILEFLSLVKAENNGPGLTTKAATASKQRRAVGFYQRRALAEQQRCSAGRKPACAHAEQPMASRTFPTVSYALQIIVVIVSKGASF